MRQPVESAQSRREEFGLLQRTAPSSLAAIGVVLAISMYLETPDMRQISLSVIAGLAIYLAWLAALREHLTLALVPALIALACALSGWLVVAEQSFPIRFVQGIGSVCTAFLLLVTLHGTRSKA